MMHTTPRLIATLFGAVVSSVGSTSIFAQETEKNQQQPAVEEQGVSMQPAFPPRLHALSVALRSALGRALTEQDAQEREAKLRGLGQIVNEQLQPEPEDAERRVLLLEFKARIHSALGELMAVRETVHAQNEIQSRRLDSLAFDGWLTGSADRLCNLGQWELAKAYLEEGIARASSPEQAAMKALRIGDLLAQQNELQAAREQYLKAASRWPDLWAQATLRAAKLTDREGSRDSAKQLYRQLTEKAAAAPEGEEARHILKFFEEDNAEVGKP